MKQHAEKQHFEMTLHYEISQTDIYLRKVIMTHLACPTMPLQAKPLRSKNKKGHLDGQYILTTLANKQTKDGHLLFQTIQLKVTPRGAKHLRSNICKATL